MSTILACIDASAAARPVLQTAKALGQTLALPVVGLHVRGDDTDPPRQFADAAGIQLQVATGAPIDTITAALAEEEWPWGCWEFGGFLAVVGRPGTPPWPWPGTRPSRWWWSRRCRVTRHRWGCTGCWCHWTAP